MLSEYVVHSLRFWLDMVFFSITKDPQGIGVEKVISIYRILHGC